MAKARNILFRFPHIWTKHPEFWEVVKEVRKTTNHRNAAMEMIEFGDIQELEDVVGTNSMIDEDEIMVKTKVHNALAIQERFWASKSRVRWLQLGDRNTKYFHSIEKIRKSRNFIRYLKTKSNQELGDLNSIGSYCAKFYKEIFKAKGCSMNNDLLNLIPNMVDMAENNFLEVVPLLLEIKEIVFGMDAFSSPGPDGFGGIANGLPA
ncbi:hypothetical protein AMTRI_Chr06g174310 [Amborella trichopoda]